MSVGEGGWGDPGALPLWVSPTDERCLKGTGEPSSSGPLRGPWAVPLPDGRQESELTGPLAFNSGPERRGLGTDKEDLQAAARPLCTPRELL